MSGLFAAVLLWLAFGAIAAAVQAGALDTFDRALLLALRTGDKQDPIGPAWLEWAGINVTHLGDYITVTAVTAAVILYLVFSGRRATALFVLAAVGGGALLNEALKHAFSRPRPDLVAHAVEVHTLSFPSGHAMAAATLYLTLGALLARTQDDRVRRTVIVLAAVTTAALVGISRVYAGVHWPTDVLAGWCAGAAWALMCWEIARRLQRRGAIEKPAD